MKVNRAIDDYMRSPRNRSTTIQKKSQQLANNITSSGGNNGSKRQSYSDIRVSQVARNKTGIQVTKSFKMLCGQCRRIFIKLLALEIMNNAQNEAEVNLFDLQQLF